MGWEMLRHVWAAREDGRVREVTSARIVMGPHMQLFFVPTQLSSEVNPATSWVNGQVIQTLRFEFQSFDFFLFESIAKPE